MACDDSEMPHELAEFFGWDTKDHRTTLTLDITAIVQAIDQDPDTPLRLHLPDGTFRTDPANIWNAFLDLSHLLINTLSILIPEANKRGWEVLPFKFADFNMEGAIGLDSLRAINDRVQEVLVENGIDQVIEADRLWGRLEGLPLAEPDEPYKLDAELRYLEELSKSIAKGILRPLMHLDPPCACGARIWPTVGRDMRYGGKPRLCDRLCPDCELEHRRSVNAERQKAHRKRSKAKAAKRLATKRKRVTPHG